MYKGRMDECCLTTHRHNLGHSVSCIRKGGVPSPFVLAYVTSLRNVPNLDLDAITEIIH